MIAILLEKKVKILFTGKDTFMVTKGTVCVHCSVVLGDQQ